MLAAEWQVGQVLWSMMWFFLFVMWIMLIFSVFGDIMRNDAMGGWSKAIWTVGIIFFPFLGVMIYLIVHGGTMGERQVRAANDKEAARQSYIREAAGPAASSADELAKLAGLHASGSLTDGEYEAMKAKLISA